jgi:NADH dehydrogenase
VLTAFERAEREDDPGRRGAELTFVVVGGGSTGVELAGALSEIAHHTLRDEFRRIDPGGARIVLVEGNDRLLPTYPPDLSRKAEASLRSLGVEVRTRTVVTAIDDDGVVAGEQRIPARTVLWGAGVQASPLARALDAPLDRAGRVLVRDDLTVPGHDDVYVVGDLAAERREDGSMVPGVAPAAMQEGRHAARNILRTLRGEPRAPFHYWDRGTLATIGRAHAVGEIGRLHLSGFVAWLAWLFVHILFLIGFRNRLFVLAQWAWHYLTFDRGSRLITETALQWRAIAAQPPRAHPPLPAEPREPSFADREPPHASH